MDDNKLTRAEVVKIANLAKINLTEAEIESLRSDMQSILQHVQQLSELDLEDVAETTGLVPDTRLRDDEVGASLSQEELLLSSEFVSQAGFIVPGVQYE